MKIEILVGMIASGKSTYARERADEGAVVISHDDLTQMLHARYRYEQGLRAMYRAMEESLAETALNAGRDVVVDRTHLTLESRRRWLDFAERYEFGQSERLSIVAVEFPRKIAHVHARRRYQHDARGRHFPEWFKVALHHQGQADAEPLTDDEGFDEIIRIPDKILVEV